MTTKENFKQTNQETSIPAHLPKKLTISLWQWNYFYGIKEGEYFHDLEKCFTELKDRGFNTIRVDSGTGLCHDVDGKRRGQISLHEPFPGFSTLREIDMRTDMDTQGGCRVDIMEKVIELFELAKKYDVKVILSSWFYLHTFWYVEDDLVEEFFTLPPERRFMRFAVDTDRILSEIKARGLQQQIAFVEIFNEFNTFYKRDWNLEKLCITSSEFRCWHEEALDFIKTCHPDLLFAIDTSTPDVDRELLPRNADVWNHHIYYSWSAYSKVFEDPAIYKEGFDFDSATRHPVLGRFLCSTPVSIEAVRSSHKHIQHVENSWPIRVWFYNNLDPLKLHELDRLMTEHISENMDEYKKKVEDRISKALETRKALFPDIILVMGEGATYCAHPQLRWEEKSDAYWELVDYATRRLKEEGYWGCVPRTHSGPYDPAWREFPERLRHAMAQFLT